MKNPVHSSYSNWITHAQKRRSQLIHFSLEIVVRPRAWPASFAWVRVPSTPRKLPTWVSRAWKARALKLIKSWKIHFLAKFFWYPFFSNLFIWCNDLTPAITFRQLPRVLLSCGWIHLEATFEAQIESANTMKIFYMILKIFKRPQLIKKPEKVLKTQTRGQRKTIV